MKTEDKFEINIKREDIGDCRSCGASPEKEVFKGVANEFGTQLKSENGWWLRIKHNFDYSLNGRTRNEDTVAELLCPKCLEEHNKRMTEVLKENNIID